MNILLLSSEVAGIMKSGGLADVAKALPLQLQAEGHDVRVVMPCYTTIKDYDRILVLGEEGIVEAGTHDQLLAKQGVYYRLWNQLPGEDTL